MSSQRNRREILRKKRNEQIRRRKMTFVFVVIAVIVIISLAVVVPNLLTGQSKFENGRGFSMGDPEAPVTVVQFSNYSCGFCKDFADNVEEGFITEYVDPGHVFYRFVNIPSNNEQSQNAAAASYCAADQDKFFDYKDYLYVNANIADGFSTDNLVNYASSTGMDVDIFQDCLEKKTYARTFIEDIRYAQSVGITGTPSFLVNDLLVNSNQLFGTIEAQLAE